MPIRVTWYGYDFGMTGITISWKQYWATTMRSTSIDIYRIGQSGVIQCRYIDQIRGWGQISASSYNTTPQRR